jgi:hypothetical protein
MTKHEKEKPLMRGTLRRRNCYLEGREIQYFDRTWAASFSICRYSAICEKRTPEWKNMAKKEKLDPETEELIKWCIEVEGFLVAGGATVAQAQDFIEDQVEWLTDQFYDGVTPEEAAKASLSDD